MRIIRAFDPKCVIGVADGSGGLQKRKALLLRKN